MRYLKAFGNWYANLIYPFSVGIRPYLRKASFITTSALCTITFLWSIAYFLPLSASIITVLLYVLIALLICSALLFLLYMITLQFDLELILSKHWLNILPHIILLALFIGSCVVEFMYGRHSPEWDKFHAYSLLTFIGWLFSVGSSAIYAQLLHHHRNNISHRYSN